MIHGKGGPARTPGSFRCGRTPGDPQYLGRAVEAFGARPRSEQDTAFRYPAQNPRRRTIARARMPPITG